MRDALKSFLGLFICAVLLFLILSLKEQTNSEKINDKIHSVNGEVLEIQPKSILSDTPFTLNTKEMSIYRFEYVLDGKEKVGWFRDTVVGDDWILDYQED